MKIIDRITELIAKSGMSRAKFCEKIGMKPTSLNTLISRGADPPVRYVVDMARVLGVTTDELLTGEPREEIALNLYEQEIIDIYRESGPYSKGKLLEYARKLKSDTEAHRIEGYEFGRNRR